MILRWQLFILSSVVLWLPYTLASPPNLHTRLHQAHDPNKERVEDAFKSHMKEVSAGEIDNHDLDHEAILGSRQKVHEFEGYTPEESKRRLEILVKTGIDANHDGFVDKEELSRWVIKSFKNLAMEEGKERLEEEDLNNDGFVDWNEHLKGSFDYDDHEKDNHIMKNDLLEEDEMFWKAADVNNDGKLDLNEFIAFNSPEEFEHMHEMLVHQLLNRRDTNKNGFLEFTEFVSGDMNDLSYTNSERYISEKFTFEEEYDKNEDGKLDFDEIMKWVIPDDKEIADNEADHLIRTSDTNQDGILSLSEIVENYETFVGSEATDFGEQLKTHVPDEL